mmetsp:Transcript_27639/g.60837  ORF Transcript_27639/g.60837 Transcript_27639/m.60837 type:complete len:380 (+) Transcript_27639:74-1213(+)
MSTAQEDLAGLSIKDLKARIVAAGAPLPSGGVEKSDLVSALQEALRNPPAAPKQNSSASADAQEDLNKLSVSDLKRRIFFAGGSVPPGHIEKPELVAALQAALRSSKAKGPSSTAPPPKAKTSAPQPTAKKATKPKPEKSQAEKDAEKEQEELVKLHLLDEQELRARILEAGAELMPGDLSKHFLVTALRQAQKAKKARGEAVQASAQASGEETGKKADPSQPGTVELDDAAMMRQMEEMQKMFADQEGARMTFEADIGSAEPSTEGKPPPPAPSVASGGADARARRAAARTKRASEASAEVEVSCTKRSQTVSLDDEDCPVVESVDVEPVKPAQPPSKRRLPVGVDLHVDILDDDQDECSMVAPKKTARTEFATVVCI